MVFQEKSFPAYAKKRRAAKVTMANITMCNNLNCSLRETCLRANAIPEPMWQNFAYYVEREGKCEFYLAPTHGSSNGGRRVMKEVRLMTPRKK